jgi:hypothetical protein
VPRRRKPFASAAGAQFWYEWRSNARVLPCCVAFIQVGVVTPLLWGFGESADFAAMTACWGLLTPVLLASIVGPGFSTVEFGSVRKTVPTFLATRPVSCGDLVMTKLRVAGYSALISWLIVLALLPLSLALWCDNSRLLAGWQWLAEHFSPLFPWVLAVFVLFLAFAYTWKSMVGSMYINLAGRPVMMSILGLAFFLPLVAGGIGLLVVVEDSMSEGGGDVIRQLLPYLKWGFQRIPWLVWILNGLFIGKVWFAVWSWRQSWRRGLVSARAIVGYLGFWLTATACLIALAHVLFVLARSATVTSEIDLPAHVAWIEALFLLVLLRFLPLGRLGLAPMALAWNRHR